MIEASAAYKSAVVGDVRQMFIRATVEVIDPDIEYTGTATSTQNPYSKLGQIFDKEIEDLHHYATPEGNRWLLDGTFDLLPDSTAAAQGQIGFIGAEMSGEDGRFSSPQYITRRFRYCSILQAVSLYFPDGIHDGWPVDLSVEIEMDGTVIYRRDITDNTERTLILEGFTVYDPDCVRVTVTRWSLPNRYFRVVEIIPGMYERWTEDKLEVLNIQMRSNFACLSTPYGTCRLRMDNANRRFEPRYKEGIFESIAERQAVPVSLGTRLPDGTREYKQVGVFYQFSDGWTTSNNSLSMEWNLVDIIGLIAGREYIPPSSLPTTLAGWIKSLVEQLGDNFADRWHVDPNYANVAVIVNSRSDIDGRKCGDVLRFACMASGTWPRADAETGFLTAEPLWNQGNKYDLDNMTVYPTMKANDDLAALIFKLYDGNDTIYVVSGNSTSSSKTLSIDNPFIHTAAQALTAARQILSQYGGMKLELTGRGDPASELGDVDTVWLDESVATTGRRMDQSFVFNSGVLRDCKSTLLQADGSFLWQERAIFTSSGVFHVPSGVTRLRVILVQGGQGGGKGEPGFIHRGGNLGNQLVTGEGERGVDGAGGLVWNGIVAVNPDTDYDVVVGAGGSPGITVGAAGSMGGHSTFGVYSSASGEAYPYGYSDVANGDSYGRTGVELPLNGSGDGGRGGDGGAPGVGYIKYVERKYGGSPKPTLVVVEEPGEGLPGIRGGGGACVIWWDKE